MFPIPLNFQCSSENPKEKRILCNKLGIEGMYEKIPHFLEMWKDYVQKKTEGNVSVCVNEILWENGTIRASKLVPSNIVAVCDHIESNITYPMDESYELRIYEKNGKDDLRIEIHSPNQYGLIHGLKTILLLLEANEDKMVWTLPEVFIKDYPKNLWRGLLVDPARHFIGVDALKKIIRVMCILKYNVLHLHLSDDQGFCFESKFAGEKFYTKSQLKDLCCYANELGIRVIPEIDIPGHVSQMIYKCPNLGTKTIPTEPETRNCLLKPALNVLSENVIKELAILFKDMMDVFHDKFFHLGGDEVDYSDWKSDRKILNYMKEMNFGDDFKLLQIDFTRRIYNTIFRPYGKIIICWDELYHKDLFKSFFSENELVIQRWRNNDVLEQESKSLSHIQCGGNVINSWGHYLNRLYPAAYYYKTTPNVAKTNNNKVIGGEGCLWGNLISDTNLMSTLILNMCPISEQLWSCVDFTDENVASMYERLDKFDELLTVIEPQIDQQNASLKLPEMCKCLESIWGGFTKGHPRNSIERRCNVVMRKIEDCVLPESKFARKLYDYTRKMINAIVNDEDNPYTELIYGEYKLLRESVLTYNHQLEIFEERMNEIYSNISDKKVRRSIRRNSQKRTQPPIKRQSNSIDNTDIGNSSDSSDSLNDSSGSSSSSNTPRISRRSIDYRRNREDLTNSNSGNSASSASSARSSSSVSDSYRDNSNVSSSKRDYSKKDWTSTQKIVDRLCEYGILAAYNSSTTEEYKSMLTFIESVETKYHNNTYIALCPAVKMLVMFRINKSVYVPSIMQRLNKTKINGTWLVL